MSIRPDSYRLAVPVLWGSTFARPNGVTSNAFAATLLLSRQQQYIYMAH